MKGVFQMTASGVKASEKNTNDLMEELNDGKVPIENYIQSNSDSFINIDLSNFWKELINKSGMTKPILSTNRTSATCIFTM